MHIHVIQSDCEINYCPRPRDSTDRQMNTEQMNASQTRLADRDTTRSEEVHSHKLQPVTEVTAAPGGDGRAD